MGWYDLGSTETIVRMLSAVFGVLGVLTVYKLGKEVYGEKVGIIAATLLVLNTFYIQYAQEAERLGAKGLLLLPHYLTEASQDGVADHVEAVCKSVNIGVVVYNRNVCRLTAPLLERLAERCPNLIGYKDGLGDIELMVSIRRRLGDRFTYLGGLPTAEVYAAAYKALGTPVYSSAVFNFIPKTAMAFYEAVRTDDMATQHRLLKDFFMPYLKIRNRVEGYGVSIIKAGARLVGHDAGPVRAPLAGVYSATLLSTTLPHRLALHQIDAAGDDDAGAVVRAMALEHAEFRQLR